MNIHVSSVGLAVETLAVADGVIDVYCPDSSRGIQVSKTFSKNFGSVCVNDESWPFAKPQPPATVKVSFDANGGTVSKKSVSFQAGGKIGTLPKPTRKGFVFAGWFTAKSGGAAVTAATKFSKNATIYARWAKPAYKIQFLANGGTGTMAVQKMKYGKAAKLKANKFKRKGHVFVGWSKTKNGKVVYANKKAVKNLTAKGGTVKLYAQWGKKVKVKFGANGGTVKTKSKTATTKKKLGKLPTPTRKNWTFEGWWTKKTGGKRVTASTVVKKAMTVYAHWSPIVTLTLNPNGGTLSKTKLTCKTVATSNGRFRLETSWMNETVVGSSRVPSVYEPTRKGHYFRGWYTKPSGGVRFEDLTFKKPASATLHAHWEPEQFQIDFGWWQRNYGDEGVFLNDEWVSLRTVSFDYGQKLGPLPTPPESSQPFIGWFTEEKGEGWQLTESTIADEMLPDTVYGFWDELYIDESWL